MNIHNICFCGKIRKKYYVDIPSFLRLCSIMYVPTLIDDKLNKTNISQETLVELDFIHFTRNQVAYKKLLICHLQGT